MAIRKLPSAKAGKPGTPVPQKARPQHDDDLDDFSNRRDLEDIDEEEEEDDYYYDDEEEEEEEEED